MGKMGRKIFGGGISAIGGGTKNATQKKLSGFQLGIVHFYGSLNIT